MFPQVLNPVRKRIPLIQIPQQNRLAIPRVPDAPSDPRYPIPPVTLPDDEINDALKRQQQSVDAYRRVSAQEPASAKGARAVGGTVATILGSLVNPQIGALLSSKILHPGQEDWRMKLENAQRQIDVNDANMRRVGEVQRLQDARVARAAANEDRDAARQDRVLQNTATRQKMLMDQGGEIIPNGIQPVNRQVTLDNPNEPASISNLPMRKTLMIPGMPAENMFDEAGGKPYGQEGAVQEVTGPDNFRSTVMIPNQATKQARKVSDLRAAAQVKREEAQEDQVPVPDSLIARFPDRYKKGDTAPRSEVNEFQKLVATPHTDSAEQQFLDEYRQLHPGSTIGQAIAAYTAVSRKGDQPKQATPAQFRLVDQNKNRSFSKARDAWNKERAEIEKQFQYAPADSVAKQAQDAQKANALKDADDRYREAQRAALDAYNSELSAIGGIPTVFDINWPEGGQASNQPTTAGGGDRAGRRSVATGPAATREFPRSRLADFAKANAMTPQQAEQRLKTEGYTVR